MSVPHAPGLGMASRIGSLRLADANGRLGLLLLPHTEAPRV